MKKLIAILAVSTLAFIMVGNAEALQYKTIYRANGQAAYAEWYAEEGNIATDTYLEVDEFTYGTDVFYGTCTYNLDTWEMFCSSGYYSTSDDIFNLDKKMNTATLSPIEIELWDDNGNSQMATIEATWNGTGEMQKGQFKVSDKFGNFMGKYHERTSYRDAEGQALVNGNDLGQSMYGAMIKFKSADFYMEK